MRARYWPNPRWLLLGLLIVGVAGMHTMGHPHDAHATVSGMYVTDTATIAHHAEPHLQLQLDGAHHGGDMDAMCLAILTATTLLILQGLVLLAQVRHAPPRWGRAIRRHRTRGPPRLVPPCLAIAAMTVLRI